MLLSIKNLSVSLADKVILDKFTLDINEGETHAIMGPNGSGKSTLANVLAGKEDYEILSGDIFFRGKNLFDFNIEERSQMGLFLAFQYPIEIPGVTVTPFLKAALNARLKNEGKKEIDPLAFAKELKEKAKKFGIENEMLSRSINEGFSGGEKKRYEILQMSILKPYLSILDETDSGLDVDALKVVTEGVKNLKNSTSSFLIITHYLRLLDYLTPDFVHVISNGRIVKTGDKSLAKHIDISGYKNL